MPYLEILAPPAEPETRRVLAQALTAGICEAFAIEPDIVTIFFLDVVPGGVAHAGSLGATPFRLFAKLHAFARDPAAKRRAAAALTPPLADAYGVPAESVALYFLDRSAGDVAHGGRLAADEAAR